MPTRSSSTTATRATSRRTSARPRSRSSRTRRTRKPAGSSCAIPVTEGPRYKVGSLNFDGNKVIKSESLRPLFKMNEGDYYSLERKIRKGFDKARVQMRQRLLRVHRGARPGESRRPLIPGPGCHRGRETMPEPAEEAVPSVHAAERDAAKTGAADRQRDAAARGRPALLRQPHHLRRQHDDARQRHPPRDAAVRERRLQHRGVEVQHQAAESARLLQADRRRAKDNPKVAKEGLARRTRSTSS